MKTDYVCMLLHFSIVSLHCTEVLEATKWTLSIIIGIIYAIMSGIELYKYFKKDFKHENNN